MSSSHLGLRRAHYQGFESIHCASSTLLRSSLSEVSRFCCPSYPCQRLLRSTPLAPLTTTSLSSVVLRPLFVVRVLLLSLHRQSSCRSASQLVFLDKVHVGVCRLAGDHGGAPRLARSELLHCSGARRTSWGVPSVLPPVLEPPASSTSPRPGDTSSTAERGLHQLIRSETRSCEISWITLTIYPLNVSRCSESL